jgi:hypothetical protein
MLAMLAVGTGTGTGTGLFLAQKEIQIYLSKN